MVPAAGAEISMEALSASTEASRSPSWMDWSGVTWREVTVTVSSEGLEPMALISRVPSACSLLSSQ